MSGPVEPRSKDVTLMGPMKEGREVVASWRLRRSMRVVERECRLEDEEEGEEEEEEGKGERRDQSMSRDMRWERKRERDPVREIGRESSKELPSESLSGGRMAWRLAVGPIVVERARHCRSSCPASIQSVCSMRLSGITRSVFHA